MSTSDDERLRLDYDQTTQLIRTLTDVRFKLLAFVPTISGAALAILGRGSSAAELLAVGALGLIATLGVVIYELRNTQIYDYALVRAGELESRLGLISVYQPASSGGPYSERPGRTLRVVGLTVGHDHALALVYSAVLGGWTYLFVWGALRAMGIGHAQEAGGAVATVVAAVVLLELLRVHLQPATNPR
jgi:hypothetical protein